MKGKGSVGSHPAFPLCGLATLTDTAPAVLLQMELRPALAVVPCHCELDTLVLAATIAQGAGADGWGHRKEPGSA
jgi:hypothetical protein